MHPRDNSMTDRYRYRWCWVTAATMILGACSSPPTFQKPTSEQHSWRAVKIPAKAPTEYRVETAPDRGLVLAAYADQSASAWRHTVDKHPQELGKVRFSWKAQNLPPLADIGESGRTDAAVRVIFAFDGDAAKLTAKQRMLMEFVATISGETPPYATLIYTWDAIRPVDSLVLHPRLDRIRKWVLQSGDQKLGEWLNYERDLVNDFRLAFDEEPGKLLWIAFMTDSDNTKSIVNAWYGNVYWESGYSIRVAP